MRWLLMKMRTRTTWMSLWRSEKTSSGRSKHASAVTRHSRPAPKQDQCDIMVQFAYCIRTKATDHSLLILKFRSKEINYSNKNSQEKMRVKCAGQNFQVVKGKKVGKNIPKPKKIKNEQFFACLCQGLCQLGFVCHFFNPGNFGQVPELSAV